MDPHERDDAISSSFDRLDRAFGVLPETKMAAHAVSYRLFGSPDPRPVGVAFSSIGLLIDPLAEDPPATFTLPYSLMVTLDAPEDPDSVVLLAGAPEDRFTVTLTPIPAPAPSGPSWEAVTLRRLRSQSSAQLLDA